MVGLDVMVTRLSSSSIALVGSSDKSKLVGAEVGEVVNISIEGTSTTTEEGSVVGGSFVSINSIVGMSVGFSDGGAIGAEELIMVGGTVGITVGASDIHAPEGSV
jgi:hypothetical protein